MIKEYVSRSFNKKDFERLWVLVLTNADVIFRECGNMTKSSDVPPRQEYNSMLFFSIRQTANKA